MTLEERVGQLERRLQAQRIQFWTIVIIAGLFGWAFVERFPSQIRINEVRARDFTLVNEDGKVRGRVNSDDSRAWVSLTFANGAETHLSVEQNKFGLLMEDPLRKASLALFHWIDKGVPVFQLGGFEGNKSGLELRLGHEAAELKLFDKDGKTIWHAP